MIAEIQLAAIVLQLVRWQQLVLLLLIWQPTAIVLQLFQWQLFVLLQLVWQRTAVPLQLSKSCLMCYSCWGDSCSGLGGNIHTAVVVQLLGSQLTAVMLQPSTWQMFAVVLQLLG
jgi:hypothetical protein